MNYIIYCEQNTFFIDNTVTLNDILNNYAYYLMSIFISAYSNRFLQSVVFFFYLPNVVLELMVLKDYDN